VRIYHALAVTESGSAGSYLDKAETYFSDLIRTYPGRPLAVSARAYLTRLYESAGRWAEAAEQLELLRESEPDDAFEISLNLADLYATRLNQYDTALSIYRALQDRADPEDTVRYPRVMFNRAVALMAKKDYDTARQTLVELKRSYTGFYGRVSLAQYLMARSFELQGNWNRAETEYKYLIETYRGSDRAMATYLHLADHYRQADQPQESQRWYRDAAEYFDQAARRGAGTVLEARALVYTAELNGRFGEWSKAAEQLESILDKFPGSAVGEKAALEAARVYGEEIGDQIAAERVMEKLKMVMADSETTMPESDRYR
jgi:tetratricopeptide (TPR) repeat protein